MAVIPESSRAFRAGAGRGEVQVGEERLVLAQPVVLLGDRLLDLQHQVGGGPDLVGGGRIRAPAAVNSSSVIEEPAPAFRSMTT